MTARRARTYVVRVLFAGGLVVAASLLWWARSAGSQGNIAAMASFGTDLFLLLSVVGAASVGVLAPSFTAGVVAQEKERGTIEVLQTTCLGGRELLFGPSVSQVMNLYLMILAGIPLLFSCSLFGGVAPFHILLVSLHLLALATFGASVGLLCSTVCGRTHQALIASYLLLAGHGVLLPFLLSSMLGGDLGPDVCRVICPAFGFQSFLRSIHDSSRWGADAVPWGTDALLGCLALSMACVLIASRLYPRFATRQPEPVTKRIFRGTDAFYERLNRGWAVVRFSAGIGDGDPMVWKERHCRLTGNIVYLVRSAYLFALGASILYAAIMAWDPRTVTLREFHLGALVGVTSLCYLALSVLSASLSASEKDRGTWDLLLVSALPGRKILGGKLRGAMVTGIVPVGFYAFLLVCALCATVYEDDWRWSRGFVGTVASVVGSLALFGAGAFLHLAIGMWVSVWLRSSVSAMVWALGFALSIDLVVPATLAFAGNESDLYALSPAVAPAVLTGPVDDRLFWAIVSGILSVGMGIGWLGWLVFWFDRLAGRSPHGPYGGRAPR
jgi:ABC-type transport system involved in multi-copper enzyme maturation permease subunit